MNLLGSKVIFVWFCAFAGFATYAQDTQKVKLVDGLFSVEFAKDLVLSQESTIEDFLLYQFKRKNRKILRVYVGNQPADLTVSMKACEMKSELLSKYSCREWRRKNKSDLYSGDIVLNMAEGFRWPRYMHFFYEDLTEKDYQEMQGVVRGFKQVSK